MKCKYETSNGRCGLKGSYAYRHKCYTDEFCKCCDPQTNADRIRAMSDEELADKFTDVAYEAHGRWYEPDGMTYHSQSADAKKAWLNWLRQPVKDGED